jgi:hypothetical protein
MFPTLKKNINGLLAILVVGLFVTAGLVFSQVVDFGQFLNALTGSLTNANNYTLSGQTASTQPVAETPPEASLTGTLTVVAKPETARFEIRNAETGAVAIAEWTSAKPMRLALGNYRVTFKPMAGHDTPSGISTEIKLKTPATVNATYTPWPLCTQGDWECSEWTRCGADTEYRRRICSQQNPRCTNADAAQPTLYETCADCRKGKQC